MNILVTGVAGFIGFHTARYLLEQGHNVLGIDNLNDYYDVRLKRSRLDLLLNYANFRFFRRSLENRADLESLFETENIPVVVHLAAQAGVRYSLQHPQAYIDSNITGFLNVLETCRSHNVEHLLYASSSSVYGANRKVPYSVQDTADHPVSLYAATKRSNELMAHAYSHIYRLPVTGLRFFTVYGPWGRPDMAYYSFTRAILEGQPITVYNEGEMWRDFTYVDDVVKAIAELIPHAPEPNREWSGLTPTPESSHAPYRVYNVGNYQPVKLTEMIGTLERLLGKKARIEYKPMHPGDVEVTCADMKPLEERFGFRPNTKLEDGLSVFVDWYRDFYRMKSPVESFPSLG